MGIIAWIVVGAIAGFIATLIMGNRESIPGWLAEACRKNEYVLVSIDYRLAPETQLPLIIEDVEDAFSSLVKREAQRYGVSVLESEIVGLVPAAALRQSVEYYLQLEGFSADQVLENKLRPRPGE